MISLVGCSFPVFLSKKLRNPNSLSQNSGQNVAMSRPPCMNCIIISAWMSAL